MNKFYYFLLFFLLLAGCKGKELDKYVLYKGSSKDEVLKRHSLESFNSNSVLFKRSSFSIKSNDINQSLSGSYFILKDSFVIFSFQALLGIEVARIKIMPNEVIILDRFNKQATFFNYNSFVNKYAKGVSFSVLQAILLNLVFDINDSNPNKFISTSYEVDYLDSLYILKKRSIGMFSWLSNSKSSTFDQSFVFNTSNGNLIQTLISDKSLNSSLHIRYNSFKEYDGIVLPLTTDIQAIIEDKLYKLSLNSNIFTTNSISVINFSIPNSYEKIYK